MLFTSLHFAIFFIILTGIYYTTPHRFRWQLLLVSSYLFYGFAKLEYIFLLAGSTLVNYILGILMSRMSVKNRRRPYIWAGVVFNIGTLFLFKYFNFFSHTIMQLLKSINIITDIPFLTMLLPVGISFYTFQSLGYLIDVYNGRISAERHLGIFALFTSFWPQLLSGPINRARLLLPQIRENHLFDYQKVTDGMRLILWGLVKKIVIADHLAVYVNRVYHHVDNYQGMPLIMAALFYSVQIYCDFSGYTDMARGSARIMGYDLMENFRHPCFAKSLKDFWQRWHISLSSWFRDYLYIPLGGNRVKKWRWHYNIFITFLISGLWHGSNWTFVVWGALHGLMLIVENITDMYRERMAATFFKNSFSGLYHGLQVVMTFCMVTFAWIFFRADSVGDAFSFIRKMLMIGSFECLKASATGVVTLPVFLFYIFIIVILFFIDKKEGDDWIQEKVGRLMLPLRWTIYTIFAWAVFLSSVFGVKQEFIYFQF
jgi:alginate O-acetyltransferase complex protein AlgI